MVGHDIGGACISYAMEMFPLKISKAVFLAAAMPTNGQSTFDAISEQVFNFFMFIIKNGIVLFVIQSDILKSLIVVVVVSWGDWLCWSPF